MSVKTLLVLLLVGFVAVSFGVQVGAVRQSGSQGVVRRSSVEASVNKRSVKLCGGGGDSVPGPGVPK